MRKGERKLLKDSIIQYVKENTAKISLEELDTVLTAEAIAGYFQVKRNTVSYYLNQEIGKTFFKINTRPVRFLDKKIFEKNFFTVSKDVYASVNDLLDENKRKNGIQKEEKQEINFVEEQDVFQNLIGSNGSLKKPIEQMKTSIFYPNTSLPVFLHGPTGSGKSFMARKIYEISNDLKDAIHNLEHIKIVEDATIAPDGTIVESVGSRVDARVSAQIEQIAQKLFAELNKTPEIELARELDDVEAQLNNDKPEQI